MNKAPAKKSAALPKTGKPRVAILMGSRSDLDVMKHAALQLRELGVESEVRVISAHRATDALLKYLETIEARGFDVIIAGAGCSAHLPGVCAAKSNLPVLGVPIHNHATGGLDALLSIVQMPGGVPVGTLALGKAGAVNAGLLAASIIGLKDQAVAKAYRRFRARQTKNAEAQMVVTSEEIGT